MFGERNGRGLGSATHSRLTSAYLMCYFKRGNPDCGKGADAGSGTQKCGGTIGQGYSNSFPWINSSSKVNG